MSVSAPVFDPSTALLVVDVQNDFADPRGALYVDDGDSVVAVINTLIAAARTGEATVVYTQDWHPASTPHFQKDGGIWPTHCVAGTWGAELHPNLVVNGPVIRKGTDGEDGYSGFTTRDVTTGGENATALQHLLQEHHVKQVVVVGLAQDVCVKETALDARRLGYDTSVVVGATRPVERVQGAGSAALDELRRHGVELW